MTDPLPSRENGHSTSPRASATSGGGSNGGEAKRTFAAFARSLRRRRVGVVHVPHAQLPAALPRIEEALPDAVRADALHDFTGADLERLTPDRLDEHVLPSARRTEPTPRLILRFEALFHTLRGAAQERLARKLEAAEPAAPCLLLVHSPLTVDRLLAHLPSGRLYRWPAA
jgi:hypothetical protein